MACAVVALALLTATRSAATPKAGAFVDDDGSVHEPMIEAIVARGITSGCGDPVQRRYCPSVEVSRGAMATFLANALDLAPAATDVFDDDDGSTHEANINAVAAAGIASGTGGRSYSPSAAVTRAQMATFLARAFDLAAAADEPFDDVAGPHADNVNAVAAAEITSGCNPAGTLFCPDAPVKRDQMASFLGRALGLDPVDSGTTTTTAPPPPPPPPPPSMIDATLPPVHGSTALTAGFVPDPHTVAATAGGPVEVDYLGGGCIGHTTEAPSYSVSYTAGAFPLLRFFFIPAEPGHDTTMVIRTPGGVFVCLDDSFGTPNPTIDFTGPPPSGTYRVWIGTFSASPVPGTLTVTENSARHP